MRLIDADKLAMRIAGHSDYHGDSILSAIYCIAEGKEKNKPIEPIERFTPTEERQKGKWLDYSEDGYVECPFCGMATNCDENKEELHFCFNCGADMRDIDSLKEVGKDAGEKASQDVLMPLA